MDIGANIARVRERIAAAASRAGRDPNEITLVAVSKTKPRELVEAAIDAGHFVFGENYVQEARDKIEPIRASAVARGIAERLRFHLIGPLQRNKIKTAVGLFDLIESAHREDIAELIAREAGKKGLEQEIFLQVNISGEETKSGLLPEQCAEVCGKLQGLAGIRLRGLMSIGSYVSEEAPRAERVREFRKLASLRETIGRELDAELPELSMGMSHDFELAIEEGATVVRVGTAIFGEREGKH